MVHDENQSSLASQTPSTLPREFMGEVRWASSKTRSLSGAAAALTALRMRWTETWLASLMPCQQKAGFKLNAGMRAIANFRFVYQDRLTLHVYQIDVSWVAEGMRAALCSLADQESNSCEGCTVRQLIFKLGCLHGSNDHMETGLCAATRDEGSPRH